MEFKNSEYENDLYSSDDLGRRKNIFPILLAVVMLSIGAFIGNNIYHFWNSAVEQCAAAVIIETPEQLQYGMKANIGGALLYGELCTSSPVTFPEIDDEFLEISKNREECTRFLRCWYHEETETRRANSFTFFGYELTGVQISLSPNTIPLADINTGKTFNNYMYESDNVRYSYTGVENHVFGTIYANLNDNNLENPSKFYPNMTPDEVIAMVKSDTGNFPIGMVIAFWIFWLIPSAVVILSCQAAAEEL